MSQVVIKKLALFFMALVLVASALTLGQAAPATASGGCSPSWAYVGGSISTGGCKGVVNNTWFRVGQKCGWLQAVTYSNWTKVDRGQVKSVSTTPCPWWSQGSRAAWVEW